LIEKTATGKINPLNAELNLICHLLALLGALPILHVSRIRVKNKCITKPHRNKILIIGGSHSRCCATEPLTSLGTTFEVMGAVMPGSRLEHIARLAQREISHLYRNDFVVIWGGANDIDRNESSTGLRRIKNFAL
jgi:hypothetical protein